MSGLLHDRKSNFEKKTALHIYAIKIIFTTKNGWGCNRLVVCEHMDATDSAYSLNLYKTPLSQYPTARKRVSWGKFPLKRDRPHPLPVLITLVVILTQNVTRKSSPALLSYKMTIFFPNYLVMVIINIIQNVL